MEQLLETSKLKTRIFHRYVNEIQKSKFLANNPNTLHC